MIMGCKYFGLEKFELNNIETKSDWILSMSKQLSNVNLIFWLQAYSFWSTSDNNPFIAAKWNHGLQTNVDELFGAEKGAFIYTAIHSVLQPGTDGDCVVMVYIREHNISGLMIPCDIPFTADWICKYQLRLHNPSLSRIYPSIRCRERAVLIGDTCNEYKLVPSVKNGMTCLDTKPYILYLNNIFANNDINVILNIGCAIMNENDTDVQDNITFQDGIVNYRLINVKTLQLQENNTYFSICGPNMQQCDDGSCRTQSIICMSNFGCAPSLCACMVGTKLTYNTDYCRHQCPPGICICAPLMFQCSGGGCIPYFHVCDDVYHCADSSDEFCIAHTSLKYLSRNSHRDFSSQLYQWCVGFFCSSGSCFDVPFVNDLIPECSDATDEYHSLSMKYNGSQYSCTDVQQIPCIPGHSKCFELSHLCVYDHDNFGHISYCRDGAHLLNCRFVKCTNSFKCRRSYCIPLRKVCDGVPDCNNGEDEISCHNNICPGYLKCSGVEFCIHPNEVCDGFSHCPHGDDEKFCDIFGCPMGCTCLGHAAVCTEVRHIGIPKFPFPDMIYLSVGWNFEFVLSFANLSSLSKLIILDLSNSKLLDICSSLLEDYLFYDWLHALYLQNNGIKYITSHCFDKLPSLLVINFGGNNILNIANDAFSGISLDFLILNNALIFPLSWRWINSFHSLKILNIRGVKLNYQIHTALNRLETLETIYNDDARICCILKNVKGCHGPMKTHVECFQLLSHPVVGPALVSFAASNLIFVIITMGFVKKLFAGSRPVQFLLYNVILINRSLSILYVLVIATIDVHIGKYYIFWNTSIFSKALCQAISIMYSVGMIMSNLATTFRDHITCMAVRHMLYVENDDYSKAKIFLSLSFFLIIAGLAIFPLLPEKNIPFQEIEKHACSSSLVFLGYASKWAAIGLVLVCIMILSALTYSILTYCAIYRKTYLSGKCVQTVTSSESGINRPKLIKLLKVLVHSAMFRSLECMPVLCTGFAKLFGSYIRLDIQLILILISVMCGFCNNTIIPVWYPMLTKRYKWVIFGWIVKMRSNMNTYTSVITWSWHTMV